METLLWNLALCLFTLFMPILLFVYTWAYISRDELSVVAGLLVLLNVFMALAFVSIVAQMQLSTLTATTSWGYIVVVAMYISLRGVALCKRVWKIIQDRLADRQLQYVDEETAIVQSSLRY